MDTQELLTILAEYSKGNYPISKEAVECIIEMLKMRLVERTAEEILEKLEKKGYHITEFENFIEFKYCDELAFYIHIPSEKLYIESTDHALDESTLLLLAELIKCI